MRIDGIADETHILTWKECRRNSIDRTAMLKRQASIRASDLLESLDLGACLQWWELIPALLISPCVYHGSPQDFGNA